MPIVRIATNLARNQLPQNFMSEFANYMAPVLNKRVDKMTCILETDKEMSFKVLGHFNFLKISAGLDTFRYFCRYFFEINFLRS